MEYFDMEKYDLAIEKMIKSNYPIPKDFNKRVEMTIKNLRVPNRVLKYPIAAAALIILVFLTVNLIPSVAIQASHIPGLNAVIDWLVINKGEKNALLKGYPIIGPVTVQKKEYVLRLEDIFIDDVSIRLSAKLAGKEPASISFHLYSDDFNLAQTASTCSLKNTDVTAQEVQIYFDEFTTLEGFLKSEPKYLNFSAAIYKDDSLDCIIESIQVPIDKDGILLSRNYSLSETLNLNHTNVSFRHFQLSPTRMVVEANYLPKDDYYITQWGKIWLKDSGDNIYDASGQSGRGRIVDTIFKGPLNKMDVMYHYFIPSLYYENEMPKKLLFCYEGYRIGSLKGTNFVLDLNDNYPITVKFLGEDIIVEDFKYCQNNTLELTMRLPEFDIMSNSDVLSPDIIFVDSTRRSVDIYVDNIEEDNSKRYTLIIKGLPKKDSYIIDLWGAGYYIDASGEVELVLE